MPDPHALLHERDAPGEHAPVVGALHMPHSHDAVHDCVPTPQAPVHGRLSPGEHEPADGALHVPHEHVGAQVRVPAPQRPVQGSVCPGLHSPAAGALHMPQVQAVVHDCMPAPQAPVHERVIPGEQSPIAVWAQAPARQTSAVHGLLSAVQAVPSPLAWQLPATQVWHSGQRIPAHPPMQAPAEHPPAQVVREVSTAQPPTVPQVTSEPLSQWEPAVSPRAWQ